MYVRVWMFPVASITRYPVQRIDRPPQKPGNEDEFKGQLLCSKLARAHPFFVFSFSQVPPILQITFLRRARFIRCESKRVPPSWNHIL